MASGPTVLTRKVTRNKLAQFLNNQELIKAFEDLTQDVSQTLPDAIGGNTSAIETSQAAADSAMGAAQIAQALAKYVRALVETTVGGPEIASLRAEVKALRRRIRQLEEGPTP